MSRPKLSIAREVKAPVFFVGMGRSGTTLVFATFATHPDLAWFSQLYARAPGVPAINALTRLADLGPSFRRTVARHGESRSWRERGRLTPTEAYAVWERISGEKFRYDWLDGVTADPGEARRVRETVGRVLGYQGKPRFAAKITGPPRIGYLSSIFADARFIQVVRDGRAVVDSLMRVPFWRDTYRMHSPAWRGLSEERLARWRRSGGSPLALAAIQWDAVIETTRREAAGHAPDRYAEMRYEDFVRDPHALLDDLYGFCDLAPAAGAHGYLDQRLEVRDLNARWRQSLAPGDVAMLDSLMSDSLKAYGYLDGDDAARGVARPFAAA